MEVKQIDVGCSLADESPRCLGKTERSALRSAIRRKLNDRHRPGWSFGDRSVVRTQVPNLRLDAASTKMGDEAGDRAIHTGGTDPCELTDVGNADGPPGASAPREAPS